ncbi:hypothetical protein KRIGEM_03412 [Komagataeibacter rhaeticus]|nr:hypothetical protein KRIGEM_03412 [Komagataeibacter rhaeticus]
MEKSKASTSIGRRVTLIEQLRRINPVFVHAATIVRDFDFNSSTTITPRLQFHLACPVFTCVIHEVVHDHDKIDRRKFG